MLDQTSENVQDFIENPEVAGTIALETKDVEKIQGVQLLGEIIELKGERLKVATKKYLKEYSYARLMEIHLWAMQLAFIKITHNRLGFCKKFIWGKANRCSDPEFFFKSLGKVNECKGRVFRFFGKKVL